MPRQADTRGHKTAPPVAEWYDEDLETDCMSEEDFEELDDDVIDDERLLEDEEAAAGPTGNVPVWRLIEMSRENRYLERELADFEDYDNYLDDFSDSYAH